LGKPRKINPSLAAAYRGSKGGAVADAPFVDARVAAGYAPGKLVGGDLETWSISVALAAGASQVLLAPIGRDAPGETFARHTRLLWLEATDGNCTFTIEEDFKFWQQSRTVKVSEGQHVLVKVAGNLTLTGAADSGSAATVAAALLRDHEENTDIGGMNQETVTGLSENASSQPGDWTDVGDDSGYGPPGYSRAQLTTQGALDFRWATPPATATRGQFSLNGTTQIVMVPALRLQCRHPGGGTDTRTLVIGWMP
jgi:hypothetical protein